MAFPFNSICTVTMIIRKQYWLKHKSLNRQVICTICCKKLRQTRTCCVFVQNLKHILYQITVGRLVFEHWKWFSSISEKVTNSRQSVICCHLFVRTNILVSKSDLMKPSRERGQINCKTFRKHTWSIEQGLILY